MENGLCALISPGDTPYRGGFSANPVDDETLYSAVAGGDERAFRILVDRHLPRVLAIASRLLGNPGEADDVAQEAMLRVWTRSSLWRPGLAKFSTWLHRITVNLCIDRMRKRRFQPIEAAENIADTSANPYREAARNNLKDAVHLALETLPVNQKAALVLCHYEGFTGKEAAKRLGVSVLAVQSLLVRAKASLRKQLQAYKNDLEDGNDS